MSYRVTAAGTKEVVKYTIRLAIQEATSYDPALSGPAHFAINRITQAIDGVQAQEVGVIASGHINRDGSGTFNLAIDVLQGAGEKSEGDPEPAFLYAQVPDSPGRKRGC